MNYVVMRNTHDGTCAVCRKISVLVLNCGANLAVSFRKTDSWFLGILGCRSVCYYFNCCSIVIYTFGFNSIQFNLVFFFFILFYISATNFGFSDLFMFWF